MNIKKFTLDGITIDNIGKDSYDLDFELSEGFVRIELGGEKVVIEVVDLIKILSVF